MSAESSSRIARLLSPLLPSPVLEFWAGRLNPLLSLERVRAEVVATGRGRKQSPCPGGRSGKGEAPSHVPPPKPDCPAPAPLR